jgi:hypothetical protein
MSRHAECSGRKLRVLIAVLVTMLYSWQPAVADDVLTPADKTTLTYHLNTIANDPNWVGDSVVAANNIFTETQYTPTAWNDFFTGYFATHNYTDYLEGYLGYPMFFWFSDTVHQNMQQGIYGALLTNVRNGWNTAVANGPTTFAADSLFTQNVYNSQRVLTWLGKYSASASVKQDIYNGLTNLINANPAVLRSNVTLAPSSMPYFATLRASAQGALLANAASPSYWQPILTPTVKAQMAATLGLQGDYARLWNDHTILLEDNYMSTARQRQTICNFFDLLPSQLHNLVSISMNDSLGNSTTYQNRSYQLNSRYDAVNVFSSDVGAWSENSFPNDVSPGVSDGFTLVLEHEATHVIDSFTVANNTKMTARRQALLTAAGTDSLNYLRSMVGGSFFQQYPQEFIASIGNEWFADSDKTVKLGLVRFDAGRSAPLNQALFMADIFSLGGNTTLLYATDTNGQIVRQEVPLGRDANGFINQLTLGGATYTFSLDGSGNVTGYSVPEPASLCLLALAALTMRRRK